jgi:aryl-alcohol dehydrogenase-like predicted oxidoreductase
MMFGANGNADHDDAVRIIHAALDAGVNFVDTADVYSGGESEEIVAKALRGRRDDVVLASKVHLPMSEDPNRRGSSRRWIMQACDDSLRRLQTDHIDLYQMHHIDRDTPWEEIWQAMDLLVQQGKVIYVGSSNFAGWHIASANEAARRGGSFGLVSEQSLYNLKTRTIELEVLPACESYGVGVLPWSPLGSGLLGGSVGKTSEGRRASDGMKAAAEWLKDTLQAWEDLCAELGERPADVAIAWLLANPVVTAPIIGPRTLEQFEGSLRSVDIHLDGEVLDRLDKIFPGPGGTAPEAYAW